MLITLDDLRRFTVARNFIKPTTLKRAVHRMGFVQADELTGRVGEGGMSVVYRARRYWSLMTTPTHATWSVQFLRAAAAK